MAIEAILLGVLMCTFYLTSLVGVEDTPLCVVSIAAPWNKKLFLQTNANLVPGSQRVGPPAAGQCQLYNNGLPN